MYSEEQNKLMNVGLEIAIRDVKSQPSADVVAVVRCKDCKYYRSYGYLETDPGSLFYRCLFGIFNDQRHDKESECFCYKGERKDNG